MTSTKMMEIYQAALIAMEMMMQYTNVVRCAIWYHSYNLKNVKNTHGGVCFLNCAHGTKRAAHHKYYQRKKGADGYLTKTHIETGISESLTLWQTTIEMVKVHIHKSVGNSRKSLESQTT